MIETACVTRDENETTVINHVTKIVELRDFHALSHKAPTMRRNKREKVLSSGEKRSTFKNNVRMTLEYKIPLLIRHGGNSTPVPEGSVVSITFKIEVVTENTVCFSSFFGLTGAINDSFLTDQGPRSILFISDIV